VFDQRFLDELIARSDIVDVVSGYVALQRKGGNLFGLCPFHNEKTPSFSVSPDKQIYHCFGCKKGGGVINFIMEIENLTFPEAVRFLAKRANLPVPEDDGPQDGADRLRRRVLELNRDAARWQQPFDGDVEGHGGVQGERNAAGSPGVEQVGNRLSSPEHRHARIKRRLVRTAPGAAERRHGAAHRIDDDLGFVYRGGCVVQIDHGLCPIDRKR